MPLPQSSVQGRNVTPKKVTYLENFPVYIRNTATDNYNELLNELKETFINHKGDHHLHQLFDMRYVYVIHHSKRTSYFLKDFRCHIRHC